MKTNLLCKHALLVVGMASSQTLCSQTYSNETIYSFDFGYKIASTTSPNANWLKNLYIPTGPSEAKYRAFVGGGGLISLENPGTNLGFGSELKIQNSSGITSQNKLGFAITNVASNLAYLKVKMRTTSNDNGSIAISIGAISVGNNLNNFNTDATNALASLYIDYVGGNLVGVYRITKPTPTLIPITINGTPPFTKDTNQIVEIYANNMNGVGAQTYIRGGSTYTLSNGYWDLWIDGLKISPNYGWETAGLAKNKLLAGMSFGVRGSNLPNTTFTYLSLDDCQHAVVLPSETTWNGSWSNNETPHLAKSVILASNYSGTGFEAKDLTVNAGVTLTVNGTIKVSDVINNGHIIVADNANFIQELGSYKAGPNSTFTVNGKSTSAKDKYAFWSSPVVGQNMFNIFPTLPQYVMTYSTGTDYYTTLINPANSISGVGYSIKTPSLEPAVIFSGTNPNNYSLSTSLSTIGLKYNLVGNPFPSNLNLAMFCYVNEANIDPTLYFWDNKSNSVKTQSGATTTNIGYATYNASGLPTWVPAPSSGGNTSLEPESNSIKIGQGFILKAVKNNIVFDNNMRSPDFTGLNLTFNRNINANEGQGKYWLKLSTPYNTSVTQAVTYQSGGSNDYDSYDSPAMGLGSDAFYSFAGAEKVIIQGKAPFNADDVVLLGNKHFETGDFIISLAKTKGLFETGQAIYLKDKLLGTYTNLQNDFYMFSSAAGDFGNRFEIVYKQGTLGSDNSLKSELQVYRVGDDFIIDSASQINAVKVYDVSGRLLQSIEPNSEKFVVKNLSKGVFILQITTASERVTKKIIK